MVKKNRFDQYPLVDEVLNAIAQSGYTKPTAIQHFVFNPILNGADVLAQAPTGSGKTLAFLAPLISLLAKQSDCQKRVLILVPVRELAVQIYEEILRLTADLPINAIAVYGGSELKRQIQNLKKGREIIVGTPGRLVDLYMRKVLKLKEIGYVVLDEADEMLAMGFADEIECLLKGIPSSAQMLFFSATLSADISRIAAKYLKKGYCRIGLEKESLVNLNIAEYGFEISDKDRYEALCRLLDGQPIDRAMIFCNTKKAVDELVLKMKQSGYAVLGLHGDFSQEVRLKTLHQFKAGMISFLVASDVASRGLDIKAVSHVINYEFPPDATLYTHRIGRTGRADGLGRAYSLIGYRDKRSWRQIEAERGKCLTMQSLPTTKQIYQRQSEAVIHKLAGIFSEGSHKRYESMLRTMSNRELTQLAAGLIALQVNHQIGFDYKKDELGKKPICYWLCCEFERQPISSDIKTILWQNAGCAKEAIGQIETTKYRWNIEFFSKRACLAAQDYLCQMPKCRVSIKTVKTRRKKV